MQVLLEREQFGALLRQVATNAQVVLKASLFVHLLDQLQWNLFQKHEVVGSVNDLLAAVAQQ